MVDFTDEQLQRYSRHIILKEVGVEGQISLNQGKVLVVGAGGLGSPVALYLAAAGVGTIGIVDDDVVVLSNLQRQILHATADVGRPKVDSATDTLRALNPEVQVTAHKCRLAADNVMSIVSEYDFVVDGTDNFPAKFLVNDACVLAGIPFSHGGVLRFAGQTMTVLPGESACYRCVFRQPPPEDAVSTCSEAGILGAIAGILGTIQATEVLKYLTGAGRLLTDTLLTFDALAMEFRKIALSRQDECPVCGREPVITSPVDYRGAVCAPVRTKDGPDDGK
ncbi:MAG: molybdopterin-synthase adenylyltransferase MoeB [Desulfobulbaceae bacterium]|nr:molybdopterin-synthase adenylyltransferase MoeB [Desulfobulbaceae bacterium]